MYNMMPGSCCVPSCRKQFFKPDGQRVKLFGFPKTASLCKQWLQVLSREKDFVPLKDNKVCEFHFKEDDIFYEEKVIPAKWVVDPSSWRAACARLTPTAVPSLFQCDSNDVEVGVVHTERREMSCLVCKDSPANLIPVEDSGFNVAADLMFLAEIKISGDEAICIECVNTLISACVFKRKCERALKREKTAIVKESNGEDVETSIYTFNKLFDGDDDITVFEVMDEDLQECNTNLDGDALHNSNSLNEVRNQDCEISDVKEESPKVHRNKKKVTFDDEMIEDSVCNEGDETIFTCPFCSKENVTTSRDVKALSFKPFTCQHCRMEFIKVEKSNRKMVFETVIESDEAIEGNTGDSPEEEQTICPTCGKVVSRSFRHRCCRSLLDPLPERGKRPKEVLCIDCGALLHTLRGHKCSFTKKINTYNCNVCKKKFLSSYSCLRHKKLLHNITKVVSCNICFKRYNNYGSLREHRLTKHNNGEWKFNCSICDKGFAIRTKLKLHMATHSDTKAFQCTLCTMDYKQKSKLAAHMIRVHNMTLTKRGQQEIERSEKAIAAIIDIRDEEA